MYWERMQGFVAQESALIFIWQTELIFPSCSFCRSSCSTMCFSSVGYNNNGHDAPILRLFVDFFWISIFTGKFWGLSGQKPPYDVWICFQKCVFWVCWGIQKLVPSQEQLWRARWRTPEHHEQSNQKLSEEHHQQEKHQQPYLVARGGGPRKIWGTYWKWVKYVHAEKKGGACILQGFTELYSSS